MTATTSLKSIPSPTPEAATASLQGSILEFGRGGHEVNVRGIDIQEMEDGSFIALAILEVEDLEEDEEDEGIEKSATQEAEELIEQENELFWLTHGTRGSDAEDAIPEGGGHVDATEEFVPAGYMQDRKAPEEPVREEDRIGINQSAEDLTETFENDFSEAMSPEPVPPSTMPDTAIETPAQAMSAEELREEEERLRNRHDELLAVMAARENRDDKDGPHPEPQE